MNLGADEEMVPDVVSNPGAEVLHEVVAARVIDTSAAEIAAGGNLRNIESCRGYSNSAHEIEAYFLAELGLKQSVKIGENRAVGLVFTGIDALTGSPCSLDVEAEVTPETNNVSTQAEVRAAFLCRGLEEQRSAGWRG